MSDVIISQMPAFKKSYKKLHRAHKNIVNDAIKLVVSDPEVGEQKKGDLAGVYIYKFKINKQEVLLAYEWDPGERVLVALGMHENFYRDLKR